MEERPAHISEFFERPRGWGIGTLKEIQTKFDCESLDLSQLTLRSLVKQICCVQALIQVGGFPLQTTSMVKRPI
jgi:hypothetical protein